MDVTTELEIVKRYDIDNITIMQLAKDFKCAKTKIAAILKRYGVHQGKNKPTKHFNFLDKDYGFLHPLSYTGKRYQGWDVILCRCICGKEINVVAKNLVTDHTKSCGCKGRAIGDNSEIGLSGKHFSGIKKNADNRELEFNITKEYLWWLYDQKQKRKCQLSALDIYMYRFDGYKRKGIYNTASLDRINNEGGYIEGNVQWVHKHINWMKNTFDQDYFIKLCIDIANHSGRCRR